MNWVSYPLSFSSQRFRSLAEIDHDIDDEIEFHIQSRIEDLRAEGMTHKQAETAARAAFGSQASVRNQCQKINYGNRIWLYRLAIVSLAACMAAIAWLGYQLVDERNRNSQLMIQLENATSEFEDVVGCVTSPAGQSIADATVYITVKTWPNGNFIQEQFVTQTANDGTFCYPDLLPKKKSFAYHITVMKPGFAFESCYFRKDSEIPKSIDPIQIVLNPTDMIQLSFVNSNGTPISNLPILVTSRFDGNQDHLIYDLGENQTRLFTDSHGVADIPFVSTGDELEVNYVVPGSQQIQQLMVDLEQTLNPIIVGDETYQNSY